MAADPASVFVLVFAVIAGTELLDRTNFALIGFSSRQSARSAWLGAAGAYLVTTILAVLVGTAILAALHGQIVYLRLGGGVFLLGYAAYLALVPESQRRPPSGRSALTAAFLLILLLELGDTTMILTIVLVGTFGDPLIVGVAAALALFTVAAVACLIGSRLGARIEPQHLDRIVIIILTIVGIVTILYALFPGSFPSLTG
jgi:putative Ca2+/H+ antiporter (TMEM165/GDT1 family)